MPKRLIGRVSLEESEANTTLLIPSKKDWTILFFTVWLAFWVITPLQIIVRAVRSLNHVQTTDWFTLLWAVMWLFGVYFVSSRILWGIGGKELLGLNRSELELTTQVFGFAVRKRSWPLDEVRNLRYVPAHTYGRRSRESCICFEDTKETVRFGGGLDYSEALKVIEQMLSVYPFPKKDKAAEYIDL